MLGAFLAFFLVPEQAFTGLPLSMSLRGQYIFKNAVIIGAFLSYTLNQQGGRASSMMVVSREPGNSASEKKKVLLPFIRKTSKESS